MKRTLLVSALALAALGLSGGAAAAKLTMINGDNGTAVGLNDPTAATPVGGNPGLTVGEQRRIVYQYAMDQWGAVLQSDVEVKVYATFARLTCDANSAVLGSAGPNWVVYNFPGAAPNTLYHSALGDAIAHADLMPIPPEGDADFPADPSNPADVYSQFNGDLGKSDCLAGLTWYYGLDGNTPANRINFLNVVMHEIGHGLGVSGFLNKSTGKLGLGSGLTDVYTHNAYDNAQGLRFDDAAMTDATRASAMKTPGRTVWMGYQVNAQAPIVLNRMITLRATGTGLNAGFEVGYPSFGPVVTPASFPAGAVALVNDGVAGTSTSDGCETPFVNASAVAGKIAIVDRGTCGFAVKVKNAQLNGAIGVIVANNTAGVAGMGGTDETITIPSVMVSQGDGNALKAALPAQVALAMDPNRLEGADAAGRVRLYSPTVVASGSTFSHFDTALTPNALMEPFDTPEVQAQIDVDLTPAVFTDIGWTLNAGNAKIAGCDTSVDAVEVGGLIAGANLEATSNMCATAARGSRSGYLRCISDQATKLQQMGAITSVQNMKVRQCASLVRP